MRKIIALFAFVCVIFLSACNVFSPNQSIEELLRAPQPTSSLHEVQTALNNYVQSAIQLKYPRGEKELSPIIIEDLDGDGLSEALALYTKTDESQSAFLCVLENTGEEWRVVQEIKGVASEVTDVQFVNFSQNTQIIVGYANSSFTDEYISVYEYKDEHISRLYEQAYYNYLAQDITGDGVADFLVANKNEESSFLNLVWLKAGENGFDTVQTIELDDEFVSCTQIKASSSGDNLGVIIEGTFSDGFYSNLVFRLNEDSRLEKWPQTNTDTALLSLRSHEQLTATGFGAKDVLHIPTNVTPISTSFQNNRFYFVTWRDYLGETTVPALNFEDFMPSGRQTEQNDSQFILGQSYTVALPEEILYAQSDAQDIILPAKPIFGVYDSLYGYFIAFPEEWMGRVTVTDSSAQDEWQVREQGSNVLLMGVRVAKSGTTEGNYTYMADIGENNLFLYFSMHCSEEQRQIIRNGLLLL